jgi:hypothetical protein
LRSGATGLRTLLTLQLLLLLLLLLLPLLLLLLLCPQAWIWQLYQAMRSGATGLRPLPTNVRLEVARLQQRKCVPSTTAGFDF